jgi:CDP-glycerol glycerophosphotransferase (TagB/SpsB family)
MVTDYSGVQFDFAYMYKPIVYFHPPELPPSYHEAVYSYEHDALGEIVTNLDDLITLIISYMESNCELKAQYQKRIDDFFYFHDQNNCQRIYESARNYLNEQG